MLSPKQFRKLKSIQKSQGTKATDYNENSDLYNFFLRKGFIKKQMIGEYYGFILTPDGDSEIYTYEVEHYRFWVPTTLSIIAIFTSILAILTQNEELYELMKELLKLLK